MKKLFVAMGVMTLLVMHSVPAMAAEKEGFLDRVGDMFHADNDADEHQDAKAGKHESDKHARDEVRHKSEHGEHDGVEHEHEKHGDRDEHDRD